MVIDITDIEMPLESVLEEVSEFKTQLADAMTKFLAKDKPTDLDLIMNIRNAGTYLILQIAILKSEYALAQMTNEALGEGYKVLMQKFSQAINVLTGISNALEINCSSLLIMMEAK